MYDVFVNNHIFLRIHKNGQEKNFAVKKRFKILNLRMFSFVHSLFLDYYYFWIFMIYQVLLYIKFQWRQIVYAYIARNINEETVFRVMGDMISQSIGNGGMYGYVIVEKNFKLFFNDEKILDSLLENVVPKTQSEEFVLKVYKKYKRNKVKNSSKKGIWSANEVKLEL